MPNSVFIFITHDRITWKLIKEHPFHVWFHREMNLTLKNQTIIFDSFETFWKCEGSCKPYCVFDCTIFLHSYFLLTGEPITLKPDVYKYDFQCQLPADLPSSLEGSFGSIRYKAILTINVPIWPDKVFEKGFTVIKPVNLVCVLIVYFLCSFNVFFLNLFFTSHSIVVIVFSSLLEWNVWIEGNDMIYSHDIKNELFTFQCVQIINIFLSLK